MSGSQTIARAILVLLVASATADAKPWKVTIRVSGEHRERTPVVAEIKDNVPSGNYVLIEEGGTKALFATVYRLGGKTYLATVLSASRQPALQTYSLEPRPRNLPGVVIRPDGKNLEVLIGGKILTVYRADLPEKPYFYPLIGPSGDFYTRAFPMERDVAGEDRDHNHQRSFWFTHGSVNGFDFWASDPLNKPNAAFGSIKETAREVVASGGGLGVLRTTDDWLGHDGKKVCEDERVVKFYLTSTVRVIDFDITLKATAGPVTFGDTKEGTFGLRLASSMDVNKKSGGKITNAEGLNDDAAWGKASPWVDYVGPVNGKTVGVAILNHPESFRYPTTWHVRTYGLFAANPFGWHDFGLQKSGEHVVPAGGSIHFGYRVLLHEGDTPSAHIADAFKAYAQPSSVEVNGQ